MATGGQYSNFDHIPVINLAPLLNGSQAGLEKVAAEIDQIYRQVGFAYLVNHGIDQQLIDNLFTASAQFHALPQAEKMAIELNQFHRGFLPLNTSTPKTSLLAKVTKPNQSESFMMMHELAADDPDVLAGLPLAGPNQWPSPLPDFKTTVMAYNDALVKLARQLLRAISVALGQAPDALNTFFERPTTFLRMLYYPPQPPQSPADLYGSAPHTDYGFITILVQDDVGGLQVRNVEGEWIDAPHLPGAFVMNTADILHRWSNGRFISTPHRVINRSGQARYSNPFFFDPDMKAQVRPLDSCVSDDNPAKFEPLIYGDYLTKRLKINHDQHAKRFKRS
ncbi:MAG: 2-oxoglutarate and iron-dependent oxygenase domain-containing protein [Chloroflexota bacterium]